MKKTPVPIYKRMDTRHAWESRRPKRRGCRRASASIFGDPLKKRGHIKRFRFSEELMASDVMANYHGFRR